MAPGRKRGAKGLKTTSELGFGDLVLAKVKGHPAWPAKVHYTDTSISRFLFFHNFPVDFFSL